MRRTKLSLLGSLSWVLCRWRSPAARSAALRYRASVCLCACSCYASLFGCSTTWSNIPFFPFLRKSACTCPLVLLSVLSLAHGICALRRGPLLDQFVLRGRLTRHHDPVLCWDDPWCQTCGGIEIHRSAIGAVGSLVSRCEHHCRPGLKIARAPVRHHALVAVGVPLGTSRRVGT